MKTICEGNFAKHKATAVNFPGFVQCDHRGKCWKIVLFAVACVRYAFPFVFEAKEERGAGLPVLAARKMEREPPIPALLLSPFSRGL